MFFPNGYCLLAYTKGGVLPVIQGCVVQRVPGERQARQERQLLNPRNSCPLRKLKIGKIVHFLYTDLLRNKGKLSRKFILSKINKDE